MHIPIPKLSLVVLIGACGAGKSTFARRVFRPTEVVSSDVCRGLVGDDECDQTVTNEAFGLLHYLAAQRLALGRLTVIDATNVQIEARRPLLALAKEQHCPSVAIVFDLPERLCHERNRTRPDRAFGTHVVRQQRGQLLRSLRGLEREGFRSVYVLRSPEQVDAAIVERVPLACDRREDTGPFDIIGDLHGCADELALLLERLGYRPAPLNAGDVLWGEQAFVHPTGRKAIFLGDLVDRGPRILDCLRIVRNMSAAGSALCVLGNHDLKLVRKLQGRKVRIAHGLAQTLAELAALPEPHRESFEQGVEQFLDSRAPHYVLDGGRLVVAHAGMKAALQGRQGAVVRNFALYGETTGETDEFGLPVRLDWAAEYRGAAAVVYGHTPVSRLEWVNRTINVDTGCVFGGALTALRWPERELVSVPAARVYCEPAQPLSQSRAAPFSSQQFVDAVLDAEDVQGKRIIATRLRGNVTIREAHSAAALEAMSRFALDPRWLIYLPPTMSPCETSGAPGLLEHPAEAFAYYREQGVAQAICQEKHMGSRLVVVLCRDEEAARERFGVARQGAGAAFTRTGRRFFSQPEFEAVFLERLRRAVSAADLWGKLETSWVCLDGELLPWSAKAQELLQSQYAAVGAAGRAACAQATAALARAAERLAGEERVRAAEVLAEFRQRGENVDRFVAAYRRYCWTTAGLEDLRFAPFHLLASEGRVYMDRTHLWHTERLEELCRADPALLLPTAQRIVDLESAQSEAAATTWWTELTERGGEGMVVKPLDFVATGPRGLCQPAVKCRGREYLRIIYGPDYTLETHLGRLRRRSLGAKRSLALGEFALGVEALERFVAREPLRRVHECVFGVLALESEPVDPRL